jgi:hypothetical protein
MDAISQAVERAKANDAAAEQAIENELTCSAYASVAAAMRPHLDLFKEALQQRWKLQINGGKLGDYVRSALTSGPGQTLSGDLATAVRIFDERHPPSVNPLLAPK